MLKSNYFIKAVPIIVSIVMSGALLFLGISLYKSFTIFTNFFNCDNSSNQYPLVQQAILADIESDDTQTYNLMDELESDNNEQKVSETNGNADTEHIDLYDLSNLMVIAILTGDDVESTAFIKDPKTNKTKIYRVGDSIRGAIVNTILSKKVIVRWNDKNVELFLIEKQKINNSLSKNKQKKRCQEESIIKPEKFINKDVIRQHVTNYHDDPNFLMGATLNSIKIGNKFLGIQISNISPGSFFNVFGIQNNDVIIGMNGKKIYCKHANNFLAYLSHMKDITIELKRDGIIHQIKFNYIDNPEPTKENNEVQYKQPNK